jgi:dipeptidase E
VKRLLLLSNSTNFGAGYLDHALAAVRELFAGCARIAFVPFALADHAAYAAKVRSRLEREGIAVDAVTPDLSGCRIVGTAPGVFVGGGNTFRLLDRLERSGVLAVLKRRAEQGMPYLGVSAGTNVAAPTIKTTNDMPIVAPRSLDALALVAFQINPHYQDTDPGSRHMGETRDDRLREYLEENQTPVVALREGAWLQVRDEAVTLGGATGAKLFRRGGAPIELLNGLVDPLLGSG